MRFEGTLVQWNEDRGFGFIEAAHTRERLFVHVSSFERGRMRPPLGARLTFDVERDAQGRKRALRVAMPGGPHAQPAVDATPGAGRRPARVRHARSPAWIALAIVCVIAAVGVRHARSSRPVEPGVVLAPAAPASAADGAPASPYRCDGRTRCEQMRSCAEATWFLQHCQGVAMDGNHDGVPCERQWCSSR